MRTSITKTEAKQVAKIYLALMLKQLEMESYKYFNTEIESEVVKQIKIQRLKIASQLTKNIKYYCTTPNVDVIIDSVLNNRE